MVAEGWRCVNGGCDGERGRWMKKANANWKGMTMSDPSEKSTWAEVTAIVSVLLVMLLVCGGGVTWYVVRQSIRARAMAEFERDVLRQREAEIQLEKERIERESAKNREHGDETDNEGD